MWTRLALLAAIFKFAVGAGGAYRALTFQLAVRSGVAHHAGVFHLPVQTPLLPHDSRASSLALPVRTSPVRHDKCAPARRFVFPVGSRRISSRISLLLDLPLRRSITRPRASMRQPLLAAIFFAVVASVGALDRSEAFIGYSERSEHTPSDLVLRTNVGDVVIRLRDDLSPDTTKYFRSFAQKHGTTCAGCEFHRAEAIPPPGAIDNYGGPGPPYALVQGRLGVGSRNDLKREGAPLVERGDVCVVGGGPDFFIATKHHHEWGNGHTVFGKVEEKDMEIIERIVKLPVLEQVWGQTHVTALADKLKFTMEVVTGSDGGTFSSLTDTDDAGSGGSMLRGNG